MEGMEWRFTRKDGEATPLRRLIESQWERPRGRDAVRRQIDERTAATRSYARAEQRARGEV